MFLNPDDLKVVARALGGEIADQNRAMVIQSRINHALMQHTIPIAVIRQRSDWELLSGLTEHYVCCALTANQLRLNKAATLRKKLIDILRFTERFTKPLAKRA